MNLYAHQQKIIDADPKKTGLFLGTGSGKTRTALMLARGNILVIAPKTQVEDKNWIRERNEIYYLHSPPGPLTVISKETFRRDAETLPAFNTVIIDEAHTCLGATPNIKWVKKQPVPKTSQLFEELVKYVKRTNPERLYLCTATIVRSPMTVWAAGILLGKEWDFHQFRHVYYTRLPMPGREVYIAKTDTATKERLGEAVRKLGYTGQLSDYFDVPDQTYKTIFVELTEAQRVRIKKLQYEFPDPLVLLGKKHQVENGILSGDEFNMAESFKNEKLDILEDLMIEFPRLVIFAKYIAQINDIAELAKRLKKRSFILTGDTKERGELIKEANAATDAVFIAQAQISAGYELPEYPVMIFASKSYSVVDRIQAEGRILRANALKKNLYIDLVVRGGIDEAVHEAIAEKKDFNERIYLKM